MILSHSAVRDLLKDGPLLGQEIATFFPNNTVRDVIAVVSSLRKAKKKTVRICGWTREVLGQKYVRRPIYAFGSEPDAPPPPPMPNWLNQRRSRKRYSKPKAPNSVFQLNQYLPR